jgi:hypothetical protein
LHGRAIWKRNSDPIASADLLFFDFKDLMQPLPIVAAMHLRYPATAGTNECPRPEGNAMSTRMCGALLCGALLVFAGTIGAGAEPAGGGTGKNTTKSMQGGGPKQLNPQPEPPGAAVKKNKKRSP